MSCCGTDGYTVFARGDSTYGEKYEYDTNFKGPKSGRLSTDTTWIAIFFVSILVWISFGLTVMSHHSNVVVSDFPTLSVSFDSLKQNWWYSFVSILFATAICLLLIYAMRWIATQVVWASLALSIALFFIGAIASFNAYGNASKKSESYLHAGITLIIAGLVLTAIVYYCRHKIVVAIALIKEGSKAVGSIYSTVFFPILPLFFKLSVFVFFVSVALGLPFYVARDANVLHYLLQLFNFFGFLWVMCFIEAFQQMVLACTFATWYWTLNKNDVPFFVLTSATVRMTRFHIGTVALGSVIVAFVQMICYMIRIIMNNRLGRLVRLCCDITGIVERLLKFFSKNSFIMCAIHGQPFCNSVRSAFNLLMRNIANVYVINRVTTFQFALLSVTVAVGMGSLTYQCVPKENVVDINAIVIPVLVSAFGSLLVASQFFGVYSMAIDTLFLCFLEDCERNDGSEQRPYYMSRSLMKVLHKDGASLVAINNQF